ncbi:MAG: ACP S-malonyltransferase [Candidatus Xiphinematobacter sp.]|nr:MAG: ACP S-malonyltransferase [Candidatus Xiphinematobacter sp.]QQY10849.1 MAG: ACP S-malonyltransferase [Candidatus Xiphinematobacter sp.]
MRIGLMFSGQGAQTVGMGEDICQAFPNALMLFQKADCILGYPLSRIAFKGPAEELMRTTVCQPALYVHGLALLAAVRSAVPRFQIAAVAGLSLGEFTAHAAAGTFDFETGLRLVSRRAGFMREACERTKGRMAAIIGAEEDSVRDLAAVANVDIANFNCPGQIILSGAEPKMALAISLAKKYGARKVVALHVDGAFHSRLMESARQSFQDELQFVPMDSPSVPVVCNADARPVFDPEAIRSALAKQLVSSVRWMQSVECLLDHLQCNLLLELGPGDVLASLAKRIRKGTPMLSIYNRLSLQKALEILDYCSSP